jgi:hypothetical protein
VIVSQMLTLLTKPVTYLGFDKLGRRWGGKVSPHPNPTPGGEGTDAPSPSGGRLGWGQAPGAE